MKKITNILRALKTQSALDELGIGTIRDAFSNLLFPGTSTLHTRAKYYVIIPYIFQLAREQRFQLRSDVLPWIHKKEYEIIRALVKNSNSNEVGIIGSSTIQTEKVLKIKPSYIYWNSLRIWGILRESEFTLDNACEYIYQKNKKKDEIIIKTETDHDGGDDSDVLNDGTTLFTPLKMHYNVLEDISIQLTREEAEYIVFHVVNGEKTKHSLLGYCLANNIYYQDFDHINPIDLPSPLQEQVHLAQDFLPIYIWCTFTI